MQNDQSPSLFNVYPNPTTGKLTLELPGLEESQIAVIQIFGMMGSLVVNEELTGSAKKEISLESHPNGVYLICVMAGDRREMKKVVKL
ncbi:MAG: T9SS type A sorting domain-containing protein [Bacteroidota bacterium]